MREIEIKKKIVYETDLVVPENMDWPENSIPDWMKLSLWCCANLNKKCELIFENGTAQFIDKDDALKFESHQSS